MTKVISFLSIILLMVGCSDDFLDRKPKGVLTSDTFFQTEEHAIQATNAVYANFRSWELCALPYLGATDIISDDADKGSSPNDAFYLTEIDDFQFDATNTTFISVWNGHYRTIFRANLAINNIPDIEMDPQLKARLVGESQFLRALSYLRLGLWFGDIPLITTQVQESEYYNQTRKPLAEVYNLIEADLKAAIEVLPEKSKYPGTDLGRATKGAARGILAKLYMVKKEWNNAITQCEAIINSNEYQLLTTYSENFLQVGENGKESVFEIGAVALQAAVAGPGATPYNMVQGVRGIPNLGWGFNRPSDNLISSYEPGDPRRQATILYEGELLPDGSAVIQNNPDILNARFNQKAWVPRHPGLQDNGPGNIRILRYSDVLLLTAEAYNEAGRSADALPLLNAVRKRARGSNNFILPDITITDKDQLRERIHRERRSELAMEQHRWFDLLRWGKAESAMKAAGKTFVIGKHELFPLPQTEIDLTDGALQQNPGY
ncbi:MAG: RagB/SusD family nutrient uptake outer membrane protein [Saprospiraceae bacterium]|nr:RagB/SusD family nutrient uptake outer membrane protein [Saprospiraceae bacterium]